MQLRDEQGRFTSNKSKWIIVGYIWAVAVAAFIFGIAMKEYNDWSSKYKVVTQKPIRVSFHKPIYTEERPERVVLSPIAKEVTQPEHEFTPLEQKIADKWGPYEAKVAIAIAKAESNLNPEALNYNTNGTYDVGVYQINSVHWEKCGGLAELVDEDNNIECAYQIWQEQGWTPWVAFNNGAFKGKL